MLVSAGTSKYYNGALLLALALELLVVWLPSYNAMTDYPVHIVRAHILAYYDSSPLYRELFEKSVLPNPNMAVDYLATPLVPALGLVAAGKVFLSLLVILFNLGCHFFGRAIHGASSWTSLGCALLVFHGAYQYGFVNYTFSVALLLLCLALWYRQRDAWKISSLLCLSALLTALFISHLAGFGFAVLVMGLFWIGEIFERRRLPRRTFLEAAAFLPAALIWISLPHGHGVKLNFGVIGASTPFEKVAAGFTLFRSGSTALDALVLLMLFGVALLAIRYREGHAKAILRAGLFLYFMFLIMPRKFLVDSGGADVRLAIPSLLLCLMALRFPDSRRARLFGLAILVVLGVRLVYQFEMFRRASLVTENVVQLVDRVPSGERFWMVCENQRILRQNLHAGDYGLARSGAISSNYIALSFQQPIWFRHPYPKAPELPGQLTDDLVRATFQHFHYAVVCGFLDNRSKVLSPYASEVLASGPCALWQGKT
jgi:hypothetical protein